MENYVIMVSTALLGRPVLRYGGSRSEVCISEPLAKKFNTVAQAEEYAEEWFGYLDWKIVPIQVPDQEQTRVRNLTIDVSGERGSGKTTIALFIEKCLSELGTSVTIEELGVSWDKDFLADIRRQIKEAPIKKVLPNTVIKINIINKANQ